MIKSTTTTTTTTSRGDFPSQEELTTTRHCTRADDQDTRKPSTFLRCRYQSPYCRSSSFHRHVCFGWQGNNKKLWLVLLLLWLVVDITSPPLNGTLHLLFGWVPLTQTVWAWKFAFGRRRSNANTVASTDGGAGGGGGGSHTTANNKSNHKDRSGGGGVGGDTRTTNTKQMGPMPTAATGAVAAVAAAALDDATSSPLPPPPPWHKLLYDQSWMMITYKPPVGIVTLFTLTHLVVTGRLFQLYPSKTSGTSNNNNGQQQRLSIEAVLQKQQKQDRFNAKNKGRAYVLDVDDVNYQLLGGIDSIRQKLICAALLPYYKQQQEHKQQQQQPQQQQQQEQQQQKQQHKGWRLHFSKSLALSEAVTKAELMTVQQQQLLEQVVPALSIACKPGYCRNYIEQMIPSISVIEAILQQCKDQRHLLFHKTGHSHLKNDDHHDTNIHDNKVDDDEDVLRILEIGVESVQMKIMDVLVRECRNRLLRSTHRLARTVDYWSRRVEALQRRVEALQRFSGVFGGGGGGKSSHSNANLEGDRLRLVYAKAAYRAEIERLGLLTLLLLTRPVDLPETVLLNALQETKEVVYESSQHKKKNAKIITRRTTTTATTGQRSFKQQQQEPPKISAKHNTWWSNSLRKWRVDDPNAARQQEPQEESKSSWKRWQQKWRRAPATTATSAPVNDVPIWKEWGKQVYDAWKMKLSSLSMYSVRWMADGASSWLSVRKLESNGEIHGPAATNALLRSQENENNNNNDSTRSSCSRDYCDNWIDQASNWTSHCRMAVCRILRESLQGSSSGGGFDEQEFAELQQLWVKGRMWCNPPGVRNSERESEHVVEHEQREASEVSAKVIEEDWNRILTYVDNLAHWRRMGEGKALRLRDAAIVGWTRRLNIFGLPLALLQIFLANTIHEFIKPHWPKLRDDVIQIFHKLMEILDQRVWVPLMGIYDEIMNRSKTLMSGFGLRLEERSLDHMLRDLGYGDGTAASRAAALEQAASQYEQDLNKGLFMNFANGRLVRLLLVQVQQLKVGLLQALDTIDVLIKGNQIHFQILAAIPSVLIAYYGTKLFVRFLYNIRSKDLRPLNAAHTEMTTYLNQLECLVLLLSSSRSTAHKDKHNNEINSNDSAILGEALLYIHRYKILLDFSSWSIPSRVSEDINRSLQQLLVALAKRQQNDMVDVDNDAVAQEQTSFLSTNMQWMRLVKEGNAKLNQYF